MEIADALNWNKPLWGTSGVPRAKAGGRWEQRIWDGIINKVLGKKYKKVIQPPYIYFKIYYFVLSYPLFLLIKRIVFFIKVELTMSQTVSWTRSWWEERVCGVEVVVWEKTEWSAQEAGREKAVTDRCEKARNKCWEANRTERGRRRPRKTQRQGEAGEEKIRWRQNREDKRDDVTERHGDYPPTEKRERDTFNTQF